MTIHLRGKCIYFDWIVNLEDVFLVPWKKWLLIFWFVGSSYLNRVITCAYRFWSH